MIHPNTELKHINDVVGYGVFASQDIPAGTLVYVKDQLEIVVSQEEFKTHTELLQASIEKYSYIDENGDRIVSWDTGKYVNHNCDSNTISTGYGFEIATRDIKKGEEITDEYGIFNLEYEMDCYCGSSNCRKRILPKDFENNCKEWDTRIKNVIQKVFSVDQALLSLVDAKTQKELKELVKKPENYRSVYSLRYLESKVLIEK